MPKVRLGPAVLVLVLGAVAAGLVTLAVIDPRPPMRAFEVPVSNDRIAR